MPFFATGLQYATSGSNLEGMETPMFHATAGMTSDYVFIAMGKLY